MLFILKVLDFGFPLNQTKHTWLEYVKNYDKKYKKKRKIKMVFMVTKKRIFEFSYGLIV